MLRSFIILSFVEGISLLTLLFVAMPMKYLAGDPSLVQSVGMIHGLLFIALALMIGFVAHRKRWHSSLVAFALISSVIPFGMIALERRLRKDTRTSGPT